MSFVRSRLFFDSRSISWEMSTALSSWTKRSSSIFCSSSAIGCSKSRKLVFTGRGGVGMANDNATIAPIMGTRDPSAAALEAAQQRLADLLARSAMGDRGAFADLYTATRAKLFAVSLRIVRERPIAEEALQDSFVAIWHHA